MNRTIAWAIGITVAGVAFAGACGNTVSDTSGSGGKGGSGGTSPATSTVTTGVTGGGGSGGTVGTGGSNNGGGDACDMACRHAAMCGADLCDQFPQVNCSTKQGMCLANCVGPASCADLQKAIKALMMNPPDIADSGPVGLCALGCLQGGGSGGGGGGQGGAGGASSCGTCAETNCRPQLGPCIADDSHLGCRDWLTCAQGCNFDPQCTVNCDTSHPTAAGLYDPIYTCACDGQCAGCADVCTAHAGEGGAPGSSTGTN